MISVDEFSNNINAFINFCESNRVNNARLVGINALALIKKRVLQEGKDSEDSIIPGYSQVDVPAFYYSNKPTRSSSALSLLDDFASYEDWRIANDLAIDKVTYFFTGEMWKSMRVAVLNEGRVFIGPTGENNIKKVAGLTSQKGEFLRPTKKEQELLRVAALNKKINDLKRFNIAS